MTSIAIAGGDGSTMSYTPTGAPLRTLGDEIEVAAFADFEIVAD
jgi:hypothetical protein